MYRECACVAILAGRAPSTPARLAASSATWSAASARTGRSVDISLVIHSIFYSFFFFLFFFFVVVNSTSGSPSCRLLSNDDLVIVWWIPHWFFLFECVGNKVEKKIRWPRLNSVDSCVVWANVCVATAAEADESSASGCESARLNCKVMRIQFVPDDFSFIENNVSIFCCFFFFYVGFAQVCKSAIIFASLVRVWASRDTTFSRTIFRAVSEQFFFQISFVG